MKTHLNIEVIPGYDCRFLSIADRSYYNPDLPIDQPYLFITVPGFNYPYSFLYVPNKINTYTSFDLGLSNNQSGDNLPDLPDGVYIIKQQICPHDELFNEYYHMRTCKIMNKYYKEFCKIINPCNLSGKEIKDLIDKLNKIKFFIDASKYSADYCGDISKAMDFYNKADELLTDFNKCKNC